MAFLDLPVLVIRVGREDDLPASPPSHQSALWALIENSTGFFYKLYVSNENGEWEEINPYQQASAPFNLGFSSGFLISESPQPDIIGSMRLYAGTDVPVNYLECDGSTVSRDTYASLYNFAVAQENIGPALLFGVGDGSTTFDIPDLSASAPSNTKYIIRY